MDDAKLEALIKNATEEEPGRETDERILEAADPGSGTTTGMPTWGRVAVAAGVLFAVCGLSISFFTSQRNRSSSTTRVSRADSTAETDSKVDPDGGGTASTTPEERKDFPGPEIELRKRVKQLQKRQEKLSEVPKGTDLKRLSNKNLNSTSVADNFGTGGGAAGAYGQQWGKGKLAGRGGGKPQNDPKPTPPERNAGTTTDSEAEVARHHLYLSNDESMSTATAQRIRYMLEHDRRPRPNRVRPHEMLNYYNFRWDGVRNVGPFQVSFRVQPADPYWAVIRYGKDQLPADKTLVHAAYQISAPLPSVEKRNPWSLTLVVDVSGSMKDADKMELVRRGLEKLHRNLTPEDRVHVVTFNNEARILAEDVTPTEEGAETWKKRVASLRPGGGTNLKAGLDLAYEVAWRHYDDEKVNRVVMLTDARANRGNVNVDDIAEATRHGDLEGVLFSGIGVGMNFNGELLDEMCERGRGAYLFLGSEAYVDTLFGELFASLVEPVAYDMRVKMTYPSGWEVATFYGEESGEKREDVQAFHFFAGSRQLYLTDFWVPNEVLEKGDGDFTFEIEGVRPNPEGKGWSELRIEEDYGVAEHRTKGNPTFNKALLAHFLATSLQKQHLEKDSLDWAITFFEGRKMATHDQESKELFDMLKKVRGMAK